MSRYAEGTTVTVERSRGEITGILATHGVQRMAWATEPAGDTLTFELAGHRFLFRIPFPHWAELESRYVNSATAEQRQSRIAAEWRRRWRANVLLLKAKLEFADGETSTVMRELMPYALLRDGRTLEEAITAGGTVPLLEAGA